MKKVLNRIIAFICILAIIIGTLGVLRYLVVDDTKSYTRVMMHEYYTQDQIDIVFCGSSLCFRSVNTGIIDDATDKNTFILGSSSQALDASYYLIKDAVSKYDVEDVFLEISPSVVEQMKLSKRKADNMTSTYIISDYMRPSWDKVHFLVDASETEAYVNSFFIARRNWDSIFDLDYVSNLLQKKSNPIYKEYRYDWLISEKERYAGKGFVITEGEVEEHNFNDSNVYSGYNISEIDDEWYDYLNKIISCCKRNGTNLILFCSPLSTQLMAADPTGLQEYHDMVSDIAEKNDIYFWDFILAKTEYFPTDSILFKDSKHLNKNGAEVFSNFLANVINEEYDINDVLYTSVEEKLNDIEPLLCGVSGTKKNKRIVAVHSECFSYSVIAYPNDGEAYFIEYDDNLHFQVPGEEDGVIMVEAMSEMYGTQKMEFSYNNMILGYFR